jgi:hypothetical protein
VAGEEKTQVGKEAVSASWPIDVIIDLRIRLTRMEKEFGLDRLPPAQVDVLLAAIAATPEPGEAITSRDMRDHELARSLSEQTFYRARKELTQKGLFRKSENLGDAHYVVVETAVTRLAQSA